VSRRALERRSTEATLDDDAQSEVERATSSDERSSQLEVGSRVDEHPGVFIRVSELTELFEAPADNALIFD
jgi:hypothetical protein